MSVQTCTVKLVKLRVKYPACQETVAASFRPYSDHIPTADPLPVKVKGEHRPVRELTSERTSVLEVTSPLCTSTTVWEPTAGKVLHNN